MKDEQLYYFEKSPIFKAMMHFSIPMMIGSLLSVIYGILNVYFIGFLDNSHMISAISLTLPIFAVLMGFGNLLASVEVHLSLVYLVQKITGKHVGSFSTYAGFILGIIIAMIALPLQIKSHIF